MKRTKIVVIITSLCICLSLFAVGVYSATQVNLNVSSTITFTSEGAYVMAIGQVYRGTFSTLTDTDELLETDRPDTDTTENASYSYKGHSYEPVSSTVDTPNGSQSKDLAPWVIGEVNFTSSEPYVKYEIAFKNYGESAVQVSITGVPTEIEGVNITADSTNFTLNYNGETTFEVLFQLTNFYSSFSGVEVALNVNIQKQDASSILNCQYYYTQFGSPANYALRSFDIVLLANGKEALRITGDDVGYDVPTDIYDLVLAKNDVITIVFDEEDTPYEPYSGAMFAPGGGFEITINIYDFNDNILAYLHYESGYGYITEQSGFPLTLAEAVKIEFYLMIL